MTEADCKLITEKLLGECWIDNTADVRKWLPSPNRTFQDPQDFFACFEKLVERKDWRAFYFTSKHKYMSDVSHGFLDEDVWIKWFWSRTESGHMRLCVLCAEWLKEKERVLK
jgi:hypothetical protein